MRVDSADLHPLITNDISAAEPIAKLSYGKAEELLPMECRGLMGVSIVKCYLSNCVAAETAGKGRPHPTLLTLEYRKGIFWPGAPAGEHAQLTRPADYFLDLASTQ